MNNKLKLSAVVGFILYALAAFFSISLLFVLLDFCGIGAARFTALWRFGKLFTRVYGICSVLIPIFLLVAAFECFMRSWHVRNGVVLAGSVIPFFTLDAIEHICRMILAENSGDALVMKLMVAFLTGGIIVAIEYLVLSMIGEAVENAGKGEKSSLEEDGGKEKKAEAENSELADIAEIAGLDEKLEPSGMADGVGAAKLAEKEGAGLWTYEAEQSDTGAGEELVPGERAVNTGSVEGGSVESGADFLGEEKLSEETEGELQGENPFAHIFDDQNDQQEEIWKEKIWEEPVFDGSGESDGNYETDEKDIYATDADESDESGEIDESEDREVVSEGDFEGETEDNGDAESGFDVLTENETTVETGPEDDTESETETVAEIVPETVAEDEIYEVSDDVPVAVTVREEEESEVEDIPEDWEIEPEKGDEGAVDAGETGNMPADLWETEEVPEAEDLPETESSEPLDLPDLTDDFMGTLPNDKDLENVKDYFDDEEEMLEESEEGDDGFGDDDFEEEDRGELSSFIEQRNNSFASIFAQMDSDAAQNPAVDFLGVEKTTATLGADTPADGKNEVSGTAESAEIAENAEVAENSETPETLEAEKTEPGAFEEEADDFDTTFSGFEFNPTAAPVVDSNGKPYGTTAQTASSGGNSEKKLPAGKVLPARRDLPEELSAVEEEQEKQKPKLRIADYKIPVEGILQKYDNDEYWVIDGETKKKAEDLAQTLAEFNIEVKIVGIRKGPVVTMFEILPAPGVNVNKIRSLQDNIALRLAATSVRIVSPIPGKSAVGIEIPNKRRAVVSFREMMEQNNPAFEKMAIPVILGKDISGEPRLIDLAKTPHLLIAGSTGSGKSVCVNSLILSILYKRNPNLVKLILIDPKVVELKLYNDIPHLLTPVITEPKKALQSLQYCLCEMERRYALLDNMGVRDISSYNRRIEERHFMQEKLPYIVVIIDEFADLMATTGRELESIVARLTAMSRAVGIHLVLATQRPSVNVITGLIKANIPSRIAFMVASRTDSNIIIDQIGAEKLLGKGDMLYASATDPFPVRIQGTLVSDDEVEKVVDYVKQYGEPDYIDDEIFVDDEDEDSDENLGLFSDGEDSLYDKALEIVVQSGKASASYLQRRLKIGYNRAARLVEDMEERGIVGPQNGSKPREVIYVP